MFRFYLFLVSIFLFPNFGRSQDLADSAALYIKEYKSSCNHFNKSIWGISLDVPLMFLDLEKEVIYLSQQVKESEAKEYKNIFIYPLEKDVNYNIPLMEWKGLQWVVVSLPFSGNLKETVDHIAHEAFHIVQDQLSIAGSFPSYPHLNTVEGRFLMHMELLKLYKALNTEHNAKKHLTNALSIRNYRNRIFPKSDSIEAVAELNEGLAEYTGLIYARYSEEELLQKYETVIEKLEENGSTAMYPYLCGSLYAFLNDRITSDWKSKIPELNIHEITAELYQLKNVDKIHSLDDTLFEGAVSQNLFEVFRTSVLDKDSIETFFSENVFILSLSNSEIQIKSNVVISIETLGTVYNNVQISNNWGKLEINKKGKVLISRKDNKIVLNANTVTISKNSVKGKNWVLQLNKGWKVKQQGEIYFLEQK